MLYDILPLRKYLCAFTTPVLYHVLIFVDEAKNKEFENV
ncbi:type III secretion protein [Mobiluncus mulieris]|uniref:Type III secretion protein n=1 Tax=Mobiluncus mulieris TaxID=2052 RepID=A0A7Y0USE1_9ACTO|nr:type III secretion protein [Mobiluncus mulieris]NMX02871.1 type III secretion protein [Mobiluncus mulieris]NMX11832.1 type III secretion protein [Mobiluncus mulieris]